jgi:hypothetical protein
MDKLRCGPTTQWCGRVRPGQPYDKALDCDICWLMTHKEAFRKAWGVQGPVTPLGSVPPVVRQSAPPKPCGGCGEGTHPLKVARQSAPTRPWSAPAQPIDASPLDGHFNGSIIEWQGKLLLCTRKGRIDSRLWITHLRDDLTPLGWPVKLAINHERCRGGQEDPRLFVQGGRLCVAFCGVESLAGKTTTWQMVAELDAAFQVRRVTCLNRTGPADHVIDGSFIVDGIRSLPGGCHRVRLVHPLPI